MKVNEMSSVFFRVKSLILFFFFFQAEDGIRDLTVTGVQTCALPISALYDALAELAPSPVVELNRAVAVAMAFGPEAGLEIVEALTAEPALAGYHLRSEERRVGKECRCRGAPYR